MSEKQAKMNPDGLKNIRCLAMDVDGVLTSGHIFLSPDGSWVRSFFIRDGMGIVRLHGAGLMTALITSSRSTDIEQRALHLGIKYFFQGIKDKGEAFNELLIQSGLQAHEVAYIGDDIIDIPAFKLCGLPIAVQDAHKDVLPYVKYVTQARGGSGAVREICDLILAAHSE